MTLKSVGGAKAKPYAPAKKKSQRSKLRLLKGKVEKHIDSAILVASTIMQKELAKDADKLKASIYLTDLYVELHGEIIREELVLNDPARQAETGDELPEEEAPVASPRLSLTVPKNYSEDNDE